MNSIPSFNNIAFIPWQREYFFAHSGESPAQSSVSKLIEGIYELDPHHAKRILRERIITTQTPTAFCLGMIRVAAKRVKYIEEAKVSFDPTMSWKPVPSIRLSELPAGSIDQISRFGLSVPDKLTDRAVMALTIGLRNKIERSGSLRDLDRPVAAVLTTSDNKPLWWALNSNRMNKTRHAEMNLLQSFCGLSNRSIPPNAKIFVTLKPCKMCAGLIWGTSQLPFRTQVLYAENDPGPKASGTVLDTASVERRRWSLKNEKISTEIQSQLAME